MTNQMDWNNWFTEALTNTNQLLEENNADLFKLLEKDLDQLWHIDLYQYTQRLADIKRKHKDYKVFRNSSGKHLIKRR